MNLPVVVIDTNVVVSGLLTADAESPTARTLDGMLEPRFSFLLSIDLLAESREVLLRPRIRKVHRLDPEEIDALLTSITVNAIVIEPARSTESVPDRGDQHVWDLVRSVRNAVLVTGDGLLLRRRGAISPRSFLRLLEG